MTLFVLSFSFKETPVELRERLAFSSAESKNYLCDLQETAQLRELMVLSTCNRVEYYYVDGRPGASGDSAERRGGGGEVDNARTALLNWMANRIGDNSGQLEKGCVFLSGREAVMHLHRVACSLESMVIGEPQILGQLKQAYRQAVDAATVQATFTGLMPRVFRTAKRVRSETQIARYAVSVSYVAVELAARIFDSLADKTILVIGAGEMAELALSHLIKAGAHNLLLCNRTTENAASLAEEYRGEVIPFDSLGHRLADADIVISSTGASNYIIDSAMARRAERKRRGEPLFFIDIAVPRDIDPAVNELSNVYCYDIDDLKAVADSNLQERAREASKAQEIIAENVEQYERWNQSLAAVPMVKALRNRFSDTANAELKKSLAKLTHLSAEDHARVEQLVHTLVNKLLHAPSTQMRRMAEDDEGRLYTEALATLFELPLGDDADNSAETGSAGEANNNVVRLPLAGRQDN